jgi:hypothetical protein
MDTLVLQDKQEQQGSMDKADLKVQMAQLEQQEQLVQWVSLVLRVHMVKMA